VTPRASATANGLRCCWNAKRRYDATSGSRSGCKYAKLRQHACVEDIDYRTPRGLDRSLLTILVEGSWIDHHANPLWKAGKPQSEILIPLTEFKVHAAEVANKVAGIALSVTGGYGYRRGPIERSYRDARAAIAMGPSNIIVRDWIGKSLVGLPLELFYEGGE
jgi:alkylation response protein AidB-like acyl-CoA dehydrogenase